jgi:hypothetical protein
MRDDSGAELPGMGSTRKAATARAIGSRKLFFITAMRARVPAFTSVMQGFLGLATAAL